jgi:hypothetical protein
MNFDDQLDDISFDVSETNLKKNQVKFIVKVEGSGSVEIKYSKPGPKDETETEIVDKATLRGAWEKEQEFSSDTGKLILSAQNMAASGRVACEIYLNGTLVAKSKSSPKKSACEYPAK